MDQQLRPRSATELVDTFFLLMRRHVAQLSAISALCFLPIVVIGIAAAVAIPVLAMRGAGMSLGAILIPAVIAVAIVFVVFSIIDGALVFAVRDAYLEGRVDVASALRRGVSRMPTVFLAYCLVVLMVVAASAFLLIPGIYLSLALFAVVPVALLEGVGVGAAVKRSFALYPVSTVMLVLLYFDARIRREGLDLQLAASGLGAAAG